MATKENISAKRKPKASQRETIATKIRKFDDRMAKLRGLFEWGSSDAQTDLSRACYGELPGQFEHLTAMAMAGLKDAPMYELMVEDFAQLGDDFHFRRICARMYLAGKCSPAGIDMAIFDAANPPLIPDQL
jgi:hypothetical protein